jgi:hypothetical protein
VQLIKLQLVQVALVVHTHLLVAALLEAMAEILFFLLLLLTVVEVALVEMLVLD